MGNISRNINRWPLPRFCNPISTNPSPNLTSQPHFAEYNASSLWVCYSKKKKRGGGLGGALTHYSWMSSSSTMNSLNRCYLSQLWDNWGTSHSWRCKTKRPGKKLGKQRGRERVRQRGGGNIDRQACYLLVFCRQQLQRKAWPHFPAMQADSPEFDTLLKRFATQQRNYLKYLSPSETSYSDTGQDTAQKKKKKKTQKNHSVETIKKKKFRPALWQNNILIK